MTTIARADKGAHGMLVAIGGAEEKGAIREPLILGRFVYAAGGHGAGLVVIPTASSEKDTGDRYRAVFARLGVRAVHLLHPGSRRAASSREAVAMIEDASGVFFAGGSQHRLAERLLDTPLADAIVRRFAGGLAVAGTSAGAAFLSEHMIAFGKSGSTPRPDMVKLARGLGLTSRFIIDQHFRQRDRLGRLLTALAEFPQAMGLGLDEDTAAFIGPESLEVVGSRAITLIDPERLGAPKPEDVGRHDAICMTNLTLHVLTHGATFDIDRRRAARPNAAETELVQ